MLSLLPRLGFDRGGPSLLIFAVSAAWIAMAAHSNADFVQFDDSQASAITVTANGFIGAPLTLNSSLVLTDNTYNNHSAVLPKGANITFHGTDTAVTAPEAFRTTYVFLGTQGGIVPLAELILRGEPVGNTQERFDGTFIGAGDSNLPTTAPVGSIAITANSAIFAFGSAPNTAGFNVTLRTPLLGDYNGNGIVDAADYTVWRDQLGQTFALPNRSGTNTGPISTADYTFWNSQFGQHAGGGSSQPGAIVEPSTTALLIIGCAVGWVASRR